MDWKQTHALVTGGASFIGSHLVDALIERGARVRVVDNLSSGELENLSASAAHVDFHQADLLNEGVAERAVEGVDVVFHLAADHGGRGYIDLHPVACSTNMILDGVVMRAAARAAPPSSGAKRKVVFASSGCVYPNHLQTDPSAIVFLKEEIVGPPYDADNLYGWAKMMGEMTLRAYCQEGTLTGASLRYFTAYGPRCLENHAVMAMIARAFVEQSPYQIWGTGEQVRNWTHVDDIVSGTIRAAERVEDGSAYNLGTMERTSVVECAREVLRYMKKDLPFVFDASKPTGPYNRVCDNSLSAKVLDWRPTVSFKDGLRRTIEWYVAHKERSEVAGHIDELVLARKLAT
jgi:nucleoside-diphosphate-sugar epimerase